MAFADAEGRALRPAILWLDERGRDHMGPVAAALNAERLHAETGKPVDLTPALYRLAWMKAHEPQTLAAARVLDPHAWLAWRLTGAATASWTSADPSGLFDIARKDWSAAILDHLGLTARQLAAIAPPGAAIGGLTAKAAQATGLAPGTPLYAAGGDGQCAGLGADAARAGVVYLNLGTAVITGCWSPEPAISPRWRTMTSPTGEGYFLEGCQRAGAYLVNWFIDGFAGGRADPGVFDRLEAAAAALPVGSEGVAVCPYLIGAMDPWWDGAARAAFIGLGPGHGPAHLYRAILEALTLETARVVAGMAEAGLSPQRIVAVGGGAQSALWTRMVADATQLPVARSASVEASALGAGMSAAVGAGWFGDFAEAAAAMSRTTEPQSPDPTALDAWRAADRAQAAAYRPG
jgi:xylulokinase